MSMLRSARALAAFALLAASCGGDPSDEVTESGAPHALSLAPPGEARSRAGRLLYYGGPVLGRAKVTAVLWGDVDPQVASALPGFYRAAVGSSYFDWLSEYDTTGKAVDGSPGTAQHIRRGSFAGAVRIAPHAHGTKLTDAAIEKELAAQVRKGSLPAPGDDTVFLVHFPPGVHISMGGSSSCEQGGFCGYHSAFRLRGQRLAYAVLPDMGEGSGCDTGCGAGGAVDRVTSVASHELVEAVTDPEVGLASGLAAPLAWYDAAGGEIGDLCNGKTGRLRAGRTVYLVQKEWSNAARACVLAGRGKAQDEVSVEGD